MNAPKSWIFICLIFGLFNSPALAEKPNIVLVMADDQGWGDMAYNGHPHLKSPNFDQAAKTGIQFTRFYAAAPVCSPTRASVLTGRHPNRMGVFKWGYGMRPQELTLAEVLRRHGYATAHFGKWHLGSVRHNSLASPTHNGFDHWISAPNFFDNNPILCNIGKAVQYEGESSMVTVENAKSWIKERCESGKTPFFAVVWFGSPHSPHQAAEEDLVHYADLFANEKNTKLSRNKRNFLGEVTGMDRAYGELRETISELGIEDNTVVWYTSDNGGLPKVGSAGDFRGHKGKIYEGGLLVPSILHWPDRFQSPQLIHTRVNSSDIFPTVLEFAGIEEDIARPLDGINLNPILAGDRTKREQPMGFWDYTTNGRSVPSAKLMKELLESQKAGNQLSASKFDQQADQLPNPKMSTNRFPGHASWIDGDWKLHRIENDKGLTFELYDLKSDPTESSNVIEDQQEIAGKLKPALLDWLRSVVDSYNGKDY